MSRRSISLLAGLSAVLLTAPVLAGTVYQWKDAKGVTHYSDSPPPDQGYQNRQLKEGPPPPPQAAAKAPEDPNCVTARNNLERLKSDRPVGLDADGDGKPDKDMSGEERAQQVKLAETKLKTDCTPKTKP